MSIVVANLSPEQLANPDRKGQYRKVSILSRGLKLMCTESR